MLPLINIGFLYQQNRDSIYQLIVPGMPKVLNHGIKLLWQSILDNDLNMVQIKTLMNV